MDAGSQDLPIVPLHAQDLPAVAALEALVFPEPLALDQLARLWAREGTVYLGIREGDTLAAYFGFTIDGPTAHVVSNATHPNFRRRGYARALLEAGRQVARSRGARWFLGEVRLSNLPQLRLLTRLGWRSVAVCPRFFGNGEDAHVVFRLLEDPSPAP
jgi:ribosomal-protein-alanine N-acetyltransferase